MKQKKTQNSYIQALLLFLGEWFYLLLVFCFLFLIWLARDTSDYKKAPQTNKPRNLPQNVQTGVDPLTSVDPDSENPEINSEAEEEKKRVRKEKEQVILKNYYKEFYEEDSEFLQMLTRYGYTLENVREFPEEYHKNLEPEELDALRTFQNKLNDFDWGKQEIAKYQKLDITKRADVSKQRREVINKSRGKKEALESSILAQLADPSISDALHQELCVVLGLFSSPKAFNALMSIVAEEKKDQRKQALFHPLGKVDIARAMPYLFSRVEKGTEEEREKAMLALKECADEGIESELEPFLKNNNPQIAKTARVMLAHIASPESEAILKKYPQKEEKLPVPEDPE